MKSIAIATLLGLAFAQDQDCVYTGGPPQHPYTLNLTDIMHWTLEYEAPNQFFYYTPCRNGMQCRQGNADFYGNSADYQPGSNQCEHYLSVDHHEQPQYSFAGASWLFQYEDGEICSQTQSPRDVNIWFLCDEYQSNSARFYDAREDYTCHYDFVIRSPLACVPENRHNAACQWAYHDYQSNMTYYLDLSTQNGTLIRNYDGNQYDMFYSPCQNGVPCYQQTGGNNVMSAIENHATHTCDHYLSVWQDGEVQPLFHNNNEPSQVHWSFHYWLSEKCSTGEQGEQTIRWWCDSSAQNTTVINSTYDGDCRWELNLGSQLACPSNKEYTHFAGMPLHKLRYDIDHIPKHQRKNKN